MSQPMLIAVDRDPIDDETRWLLDQLAIAQTNQADMAKIVRAIIRAAREHGPVISANDARAYLVDEDGRLTVKPQLVGTAFSKLVGLGALVKRGHVLSDDYHSRNGGKPLQRYRYVPHIIETGATP